MTVGNYPVIKIYVIAKLPSQSSILQHNVVLVSFHMNTKTIPKCSNRITQQNKKHENYETVFEFISIGRTLNMQYTIWTSVVIMGGPSVIISVESQGYDTLA